MMSFTMGGLMFFLLAMQFLALVLKMNKIIKFVLYMELLMLKMMFFFTLQVNWLDQSSVLMMLLVSVCEAAMGLSMVVVLMKKNINLNLKSGSY